MAKINTRVTVNTPQAAAKIKAACNTALTDMGLQALQDVSKHVPHDQGTLEDSGLTNSYKRAVKHVFKMRWHTPYARYLWNGDVMYGNPTERRYGPQKISFTSALAHEEWAKYVPYDLYPAYLDEGEWVLTKEEADVLRSYGGLEGMIGMIDRSAPSVNVSVQGQSKDFDYEKFGRATVDAMIAAGIGFKCDDREFARLIKDLIDYV